MLRAKLFDPTLSFPVTQPIFDVGEPGPYEWNGNRFWIIDEYTSPDTSEFIVAYKSADGGRTFSRIPPPTPLDNHNGNVSVFWPGSGSIIYVAWQDQLHSVTRGHINTTTFDMATETWGAVNYTGVDITTGGLIDQLAVFISGGDLVVVWGHSGSVNAVIYDGVSWSAPIVIAAGTFDNAVLDGAGNVGIWWDDGTDIHYSILAAGVVVFTTTALSLANFALSGFPYSQLYDPATDSVVWIILQQAGFGQPVTIDLLVGTPSAAPVFSIINVATDPTHSLGWIQPVIAGKTGEFSVLIWSEVGVEDLMQQYLAPALAGPWTGPTTYYDQEANPPTPPPSVGELFPIYERYLANGSLAVTVGMFYPIAGGPTFCGVLADLVDICWPFPIVFSPAGAFPQRTGERV